VDNLLLYVVADGAVMAVPLDLKRLRTTGAPVAMGPVC
jgi:hypothetical protein